MAPDFSVTAKRLSLCWQPCTFSFCDLGLSDLFLLSFGAAACLGGASADMNSFNIGRKPKGLKAPPRGDAMGSSRLKKARSSKPLARSFWVFPYDSNNSGGQPVLQLLRSSISSQRVASASTIFARFIGVQLSFE